jgi:hypothetical protein
MAFGFLENLNLRRKDKEIVCKISKAKFFILTFDSFFIRCAPIAQPG